MSKEGKGKKVKPVDNVTVYATEKLKEYYGLGAPIECHTCVADKLVEAGKATKEAPKVKLEKEDK